MANPTTNYSFAMPTNSDLVKDLPADFDIFGQAVDDRIKALNPETTAGDISYRASTANAKSRLAIGTAGQVLTVNAGATAPEWATLSAGQANWSLLNTGGTSLSGSSTVTVSGISGKDKIMIIFTQTSSANASSSIRIRINGDSANNYYQYGSLIIGAASYSADNFRQIERGGGDSFLMAQMNVEAASSTEGYLLMTGCNTSGVKVFNAVGSKSTNDVDGRSYYSGGYYDSSSTISSISLLSSSGNFDGGTVYVYTSA